MVISGSCLCKNLTYDIEGDGDLKHAIVCHCLNCRKLSGSTYGTNLHVPRSSVTIRGTPKVFTRKGDSGKNVSINFCGICGHTIFVAAELYSDEVIIKAGTIDDEKWLSLRAPVMEIYCKDKMEWLPQIAEVALSKT